MELLNILNKMSFSLFAGYSLLITRHCIYRIDPHAASQHHRLLKHQNVELLSC